MKIVHIVAGLKFGGVAEVASMLALHQQKPEHQVTLVTVSRNKETLIDAAEQASAAGVQLVRFAIAFPAALFFSWQMMRQLRDVCATADVVHVHSNWTFPVWWGCRIALKHQKKLVMTPHGCLSPERFEHSKWKKRLVGWIDSYYLRRADVIHATCEEEALAINKFIAKAGSIASRMRDAGSTLTNELEHPCIVVVPNGVNLEEFDGEIDEDFWKKRFPEIGERKVFLALGRLHPLKGLDLLVAAWGGLLRPPSGLNGEGKRGGPPSGLNGEGKRGEGKRDFGKSCVLVIAGPDEHGTLADLKAQVASLNLESDVLFPGSIPALERAEAVASAHCLVLPSRHENFGLTVVEALACHVPVIATNGTPWAELRGRGDLLRPPSGLNDEGKRGGPPSGLNDEGKRGGPHSGLNDEGKRGGPPSGLNDEGKRGEDAHNHRAATQLAWPVYFFESDTSGEKPYEEFYTPGEELDEERFVNLGVVKNSKKRSLAEIDGIFESLHKLFEKPQISKSDVVHVLKDYLPNFEHIETGKGLDQKM
ncbi:MAG: glycosyltransferase [Kiritimatiellia bacterium]